MGDYKIVDRSPDPDNSVLNVLTLGIKPIIESVLGVEPPQVYTVEDAGGNRHTVSASNRDELGEKIARGDFRN